MWRVCFSALDSFLKGDAVGHAAHWVLSLKLLQLSWRVLVKELIQRQEATSDTDLDLILDALNHDALGTELVDSLRLTHEHDLELLPVWVVVDVLSQLLVDHIVFDRDVNSDTRFKVDDILAQLLNLIVCRS